MCSPLKVLWLMTKMYNVISPSIILLLANNCSVFKQIFCSISWLLLSLPSLSLIVPSQNCNLAALLPSQNRNLCARGTSQGMFHDLLPFYCCAALENLQWGYGFPAGSAPIAAHRARNPGGEHTSQITGQAMEPTRSNQVYARTVEKKLSHCQPGRCAPQVWGQNLAHWRSCGASEEVEEAQGQHLSKLRVQDQQEQVHICMCVFGNYTLSDAENHTSPMLSTGFLKEIMWFRKIFVLYLEVVWVQFDPWHYQAGPANALGANESSACDGVRVSNFCQRSPFAMHYLTGLPNAFGAHGNSACDGVRVGNFYL